MTKKYAIILAVIGIILLSNSIVILFVSTIYNLEYEIKSPLSITIFYYVSFVTGIILLFLYILLFLFNWYFQHPYRIGRIR